MESPKSIRRTPPKNVGLLELIRAKRERDWKPSVEELKNGFRGWHQRGYLPHFDAPGVTQFVTFQLHDSFPVTRRAEWETILRERDDSAKRKKLEAWLDSRSWRVPASPAQRGGTRRENFTRSRWTRLSDAGVGCHAEPCSSGHGRLGRAADEADQWLERQVITTGERASASQRAILAGGLLRHTHPGRGAFEARHPVRGTESHKSVFGESSARMAVVQRPSSR